MAEDASLNGKLTLSRCSAWSSAFDTRRPFVFIGRDAHVVGVWDAAVWPPRLGCLDDQPVSRTASHGSVVNDDVVKRDHI